MLTPHPEIARAERFCEPFGLRVPILMGRYLSARWWSAIGSWAPNIH